MVWPPIVGRKPAGDAQCQILYFPEGGSGKFAIKKFASFSYCLMVLAEIVSSPGKKPYLGLPRALLRCQVCVPAEES
jgi:hypothetical protein